MKCVMLSLTLLIGPGFAHAQDPTRGENRGGAIVLHWSADEAFPDELTRLVRELRSRADVFVFLSGGATSIEEPELTALADLFRCFDLLSKRGLRLAVGDGGTKAGIMDAAGRARAASGNAFPLLGIPPAPEVGRDGRSGTTPIDENHSYVLTVTNEPWLEGQKEKGWEPSWGYWGSETEAMYEVFGRLAAGRPSVTILANGGGVTIDEVEQNLRQGRRMIVLAGSGRAADAVVAALEGKTPDSPDAARYSERVQSLGVREKADRFRIFPMSNGAEALADVLMEELNPPR